MPQDDFLPYQSLMDAVRDYCAQRRTGTVFIVSSDNKMAQVHLQSGAIVALLCRGRRGLDAIASIRDMIAGRLRFDENFVSASTTERFDTDKTLALLGCGEGGPRPSPMLAPALAPAQAPAPAPQVPVSGAGVSATHAAKLEAILIQYIGPMGEIVCADYVAEAADVRSLITALSGEVPDKAQATQFIRDAAAALGLG